MHVDRYGNTSRQKCRAKGSRNETYERLRTFARNLEHEMYDYTGSNWSHRNSNKRFKEKIGSHTKITFTIFTTKDSCTWNITYNTESTAV